MEWKSAMQHSGASGRQAILGAVRAVGSVGCARFVAWHGARRLVGTIPQYLGSRRELLDAQGGCGLRGGCFLLLWGDAVGLSLAFRCWLARDFPGYFGSNLLIDAFSDFSNFFFD